MKSVMKNNAPSVMEGAVMEHHPYGPSKWPALLECPSFESKPPSEETRRGQELHSLFEAVMRGTYKDTPADMLEEHVVQMANRIKRTTEPTLGRFYAEETVTLPGVGGIDDDSGIYGRLDLAWIDVETLDLHVLDLKLCENPDRDHRPQLLAYAAGMLRHLRLEGPRNVVLHVAYADSARITEETLDVGDATTEYLRNYMRIAEIGRGKACEPRQCGWCVLCAKFADCPAMKAVVDKAGPRLADAAKPERWADLSSKQKAQACVLAETLSKWCAAVKEHAAADAKAGELIEDPEHCIWFGLQERRGRFVIPDVLAAWELVKPHLTAEGYRACLSVNHAELKAALKKSGMKFSDVDALVERLGTRLPSTTVFVRRGLKESA